MYASFSSPSFTDNLKRHLCVVAFGLVIALSIFNTVISALFLSRTPADWIRPASISANILQDGTIAGAQIAPGAITGPQIANGAITNAMLAAQSVDASNIVAGTITGNQIALNSISTAQIQPASITPNLLAPGIIPDNTFVPTVVVEGDAYFAFPMYNTLTGGLGACQIPVTGIVQWGDYPGTAYQASLDSVTVGINNGDIIISLAGVPNLGLSFDAGQMTLNDLTNGQGAIVGTAAFITYDGFYPLPTECFFTQSGGFWLAFYPDVY